MISEPVALRPVVLLVTLSFCILGCRAHDELNPAAKPPVAESSARQGFLVIPGPTNAIQFRLYTNASPTSSRLFNTFEIEAYGETLLQSLGEDSLKRWLATPHPNPSFHNILINGEGPQLGSANAMTLVDDVSGPEWRYIALDVSAAYRNRLEQFRRGVLYIEPDLFVVYDHIVAKEPVSFQMRLHPPAATRVDSIWHDLRLDSPRAGFRINAPGEKGMLRAWEQIDSAADTFLPGTATMQLGPTNKLVRLDLLTVFAVYRGGEKKDYAFKLLESNTAVGARIHRDGWPTLVAFRTEGTAGNASLIGFGFNGPVGVDVFRPKRK